MFRSSRGRDPQMKRAPVRKINSFSGMNQSAMMHEIQKMKNKQWMIEFHWWLDAFPLVFFSDALWTLRRVPTFFAATPSTLDLYLNIPFYTGRPIYIPSSTIWRYTRLYHPILRHRTIPRQRPTLLCSYFMMDAGYYGQLMLFLWLWLLHFYDEKGGHAIYVFSYMIISFRLLC